MSLTEEEAACQLLEVVPILAREIRSEMRNRSSPDLTVPQFRALNFVNRKVGCSLFEVADHLGLTAPSTCRLIDGLISRGMMTREDCQADRRRLRLTVTQRGQNILEASRQGTLAHLAEKLSNITIDEREVVIKAMKTLQSIFTNNPETGSVVK